MLSRSDIARLITGRIRLLRFILTDREIDLLATALPTLETLHNRVVAPDEPDETDAGSLLGQLRAGRDKAKLSAEAVKQGASALRSLERGGLELAAEFAEAPVWSALGSADVLIAVRRRSRAGARGAAGPRSRR